MKFFANWRGDLFGGLTTSVVALPLSIAFGVAAFAPLGPEFVAQGALAGLYTSVIAGALASLFGGTPSQISGPTVSMTVIMTSVIANLMKSPEIAALGDRQAEVILLLAAITILSGGLFQILLGAAGGGKLIKFIPYPVVAGFMNGIAVVVFLGQLHPFFGVENSHAISAIFMGEAGIRYEILAVGIVTVIATIVGGKFIKAVPGALIGMVAGVLAYFLIGNIMTPGLLRLEDNPLIVGPIPKGLPSPSQAVIFFSLAGDIPGSLWLSLIVPALTLGILAAIDTLLTSLVADMVTKTKHQSNKELIGQGIGNLASAVFGGLPAAGSTPVTLVNINAGGRLPFSGVVKSLVVLLIVLVLGPLVQWIPMAVLAGILLVTAFKMVDYESLNLFKKKSAMENMLIIMSVTIITVSIDLIVAVVIGLVIASFLFVKEQIGKTIVRRKYTGDLVHSKKVRDRESMEILEQKGHLITVYELSGSLFFGTCDKLFTEIEKDLHSLCIVLDLKRVNTIDLTGAQLIRQIVDRVQDCGSYLLLSYLDVPGEKDKERLRKFLEDLDVISAVGEGHIFRDTDRALEWAEDKLIEQERAASESQNARLALRNLEVFSKLTSQQLEVVQQYVKPRQFKKGEIVFAEGDSGDGIYFILTGYVSVLADFNQNAHAHRLTTFAEGVFFGDMAILEDQPRSATVRAEIDTELLFMTRDDFQHLTENEPALATHMLLGISRELSYRLRLTTQEVRVLAE
jgi:SulP family sulfate permease